MKEWTDEELGSLLHETFASREPLANPDTARRIAAGAVDRRRRWLRPVGVAAAVVLVAGAGLTLKFVDDRPQQPATTGTPSPSSTQEPVAVGGSYQDHLSAAAEESQRAVDSVLLPDGAEQTSAEPPGGAFGEQTVGPSDPQLTRTAWWTVPVPPAEITAYIVANLPPGFVLQGDYVSDAHTVAVAFLYQRVSPAPTAYAPVYMALRWKASGSGTLVRADTFTAAYDVRDPQSMVDNVTSVEVSHVPQTGPNQTPEPDQRTYSSTEQPAAVQTLVDALNALPASTRIAPDPRCAAADPPGTPETDTLTFHEAGGDTVVATLVRTCLDQVNVTRNGDPLLPTLDPGQLHSVVTQAIAGPRPA